MELLYKILLGENISKSSSWSNYFATYNFIFKFYILNFRDLFYWFVKAAISKLPSSCVTDFYLWIIQTFILNSLADFLLAPACYNGTQSRRSNIISWLVISESILRKPSPWASPHTLVLGGQGGLWCCFVAASVMALRKALA